MEGGSTLFDTTVLSIDIGNKNIKFVTGKAQGNSVLVNKAFMVPTPLYSFNDGKISDMEALKSAISQEIKAQGIKTKKVVFTFESSSVISREIILPLVKEEELSIMVNYEIEQYFPIVVSDYIVNYKVLESFQEDDLNKARILVAALPKGMGEEYLTLIRELKLTPVALDINSNAISKLFYSNTLVNFENSSLEKTVAIIDIGHRFINVSIIKNGTVQFSRLISNGGKEIDMNIANSFNLSFEQAESKKINGFRIHLLEEKNVVSSKLEVMDDNNLGNILQVIRERARHHRSKESSSAAVEEASASLDRDYKPDEIKDNEKENFNTASSEIANEIVKATVNNWLYEIQKILKYYSARSMGNTIDEIYLHGGSSNIPNLDGYIQGYLEIPTYKIRDLNNIRLSKSYSNTDVEFYLSAIGAIIRK